MGGLAGLAWNGVQLQQDGTAGPEFANVRQTQRLSAGELFRVRGQRFSVVGGDLVSRPSGGMGEFQGWTRRLVWVAGLIGHGEMEAFWFLRA
jgi:hypothetical protein